MPPHVSQTNRRMLTRRRMPLHWLGVKFKAVLTGYACKQARGEALALAQQPGGRTPPVYFMLLVTQSGRREHVSQPRENTQRAPLVCMFRVSPAGWHRYMHVWTGLVWSRVWLHISEG